MADDIREKVKKRIALALGSNNEHEARNAAMAACRLIAEHKLLDEPPPRSRGFAPPQHGNPFDELFRAMQDMGGEGFFVNIETPRPTKPPPQPRVERVPRKPKRDASARDVISTHQSAFCTKCGQRILRGKQTTVLHGNYYHPNCYIEATEP